MADLTRDQLVEFFSAQGVEEPEEMADRTLDDISRIMPTPDKICRGDELLHLARIAQGRGYNRQMPEWLYELVDPAGWSVATFALVHEHANGVEVAPHVRVSWLVKTTQSTQPENLILDCDATIFMGLPSAEDKPWET